VSHFSRQYKYSDRVREGCRIKGFSVDLKLPPFRRLAPSRGSWWLNPMVGWQWSAAANGGVATTTTTTLVLNYVA